MIDHLRKTLCLTGWVAIAASALAADWSGPAPEQIPPVTVRWEGPERKIQIVEGAAYRVAVRREPTEIIALEVNGTNLLAAPIIPGFVDDKGVRYVPQRSGVPRWQTYQGQSYKQARDAAARFNVWNAGPHYWDAHVLDIPLIPEQQANSPVVVPDGPVVRGEIVFHSFADRLNIEFRVDPERVAVKPVKASWTFNVPVLKHTDLGERKLLQFGGAALLGLPEQTYATGRLEVPLATGSRCWWVLRPTGKSASPADLFQEELHPLPATNFSVRNGRYLGYDAAAGLHTIEAITPGLNFNSAYDNPNRRIEIPVAIKSDGRQRRIVCKSISHVGMLPATVLADEHGFMLPTPVLSCKNFAGEREEPDDNAFGYAVFPVGLAAHEEKQFRILHLFQNWGDHMLKQVSSIRFFNIYWHLSTGVSETTCFTIPPMKLNGVWVLIPDYRPYSGAFFKPQPQHDCQSWPGLLQYQTADGDVRLEYDKTVFKSIAPNLAHFTMHFTSSDGAARATATTSEIPQSDEMRTFLKIRYDFTKDVAIRGDARDAFRWLNINDKAAPQSLVYLDEDGKAVSEVITNGQHQALGKPLGAVFPFVGTHGMPGNHGTTYYGSLVLIRSFKARLAGKEQEQVFFSSRYKHKGNYWLTTADEALTIKAGDFLEAELLLVPHAEGTEPLVVPERERRYYGTEGPTATVQNGRLLSTFPATVEAVDEVAALTITGGTEVTPVTVKGFAHWAVPLLWIDGVWQNQQAHGGDGYQVNPDGPGKYRFTFLVKQRQGDPRTVIITRAQCNTGISKVDDRSGYLELITDAEKGEFALKAPAIFGPGMNRVATNAMVSEFKGTAKAVRQIPLKVTPAGAPVEVTINAADEQGMDLFVAGSAELEFRSLMPATNYRLTIDGHKEVRRTASGAPTLRVAVGSGNHTLSMRALCDEKPH